MASLFQKLEFEAFRKGITPRTKESRAWFMNKAKNLSVSRGDLMKQEPLEFRSRPAVGRMYMYFYDPKHKEKLPYYDRFPLIVMVGPARGGFMGLNLHYLPHIFRARLMDRLYNIQRVDRLRDSKKLRLSYSFLSTASKFRYFQPTVKRYLNTHVRSRFLYIPAEEWDIALMLPTERFKKTTKNNVWRESRKRLRVR